MRILSAPDTLPDALITSNARAAVSTSPAPDAAAIRMRSTIRLSLAVLPPTAARLLEYRFQTPKAPAAEGGVLQAETISNHDMRLSNNRHSSAE